MIRSLPDYVEAIISRLNNSGFEAFAVGGCVRDAFLDIVPSDWDIATNAKPDAVRSLFEHTADTGVKHGTITVVYHGKKCEVTTYRLEKGYTDFRRPDSVIFTDSIYLDLMRRDFTMNALAFHPAVGVIDPFGGIRDIKNGIIRAAGDPSERFSEDALRMLRAVRFKSQLGFNIDAETENAIRKKAYLVSEISMPRIRSEFEKTLLSAYPEFIRDYFELGLMKHMLPELDELYCMSALNTSGNAADTDSTFRVLSDVPCELSFRWAALLFICIFHNPTEEIVASVTDCAKEGIVCILKRAGSGAAMIRSVISIIKGLTSKVATTAEELRLAAGLYEPLEYRKILLTKLSFTKAQDITYALSVLDNIIDNKEPVRINDLCVNGDDLKKIGITEGVKIGKTLNTLLASVIKDPSLNNRDTLLRIAELSNVK